jgi:hypothetical protein
MFFAVEVQAGQDDDKGEYITEVLKDAQDIMKGVPILDITSVPAHAVVAVEQEFIHLRTDVEDELKNLIKERITVTKDKNKQEIDTKMAKVKIPSKEANKAVAEGIVGKGIGDDKGEIEKDGEKSTYDLAMQQQANWTSAAGSLNAQEEYEKKRAYIEQEQAIRMLGTVGVLRKNIEKKLLCSDGPMQKLASNYEQSDAKKDLDPNGKAKKSTDVTENALDEYKMVEKTNDYNQVLRQYAFNGLVYDQLLSLEQQVLGLRLQAVAGKSAQDMDTLSDKLTTNKQQDEAVADQ